MLPLLPMFHDDSNPSPERRQRLALMLIAFAVAAVLGTGLLVARSGSAWITLTIFGSIVLVGLMLIGLRWRVPPQTTEEKRKRALEGQDMYSLIDRLVADLDADEMDYLQQRLRDRQVDEPNPLANDLEDALARRAEDREAGLR